MKETKHRRQAGAKGGAGTDEAIHDEIARAILFGEIEAGTKLPEHKLAAIFGVSRERIRKVLHRLGAERRLEIIPNRGAFVPKPTIDEVRMVYQAHRVVEAGIIEQLVRIIDGDIIARLERHLVAERAAAAHNDRVASVRLSGEFHLHLVDALGNTELSRFLRELLGRSSVMVSVYEPASESLCAADEHAAIVAALRDRDAERAIRLSRDHFEHVEGRLHFDRTVPRKRDLDTVFRRPGSAPKGRR